MARYRGNFTVAANYEPHKAAPFDARALVETKADLIAASTWVQRNGSIWVYSGMIVSVSSDIEPKNNGVYVLTDAKNYHLEECWRKLADVVDIAELQEKIDNLEIGGNGDIEVDSESELPEEGEENITYYIQETQSI